jgi:hypothetical protein
MTPLALRCAMPDPSDETVRAWELKPESEGEYVDVDPIVSVELFDQRSELLGSGESRRRSVS